MQQGRHPRPVASVGVAVILAVVLTLVPVLPPAAEGTEHLPSPFKVTDIMPGPDGSFPHSFAPLGNGVVFSAVGPGVGRELYFSDATPEGTVLLADLAPGETSSSPSELVAVPALGLVFFRAASPQGTELFATDGTPAGTRLVADIIPGGFGSFPRELAAGAGVVYFGAHDAAGDEKVWASDGTAEGTNVLDGIPAGTEVVQPQDLTEVADRVYFTSMIGGQRRLNRSGDGTFVTIELPGDPASNPGKLTNLHDELLVLTVDLGGDPGRQLATVDPADGEVGTVIVNPDGSAFPPSISVDGPFAVVNPLLGVADTGAAGVQIFETDGTQEGTRTVTAGGSGLGSSFFGDLVPLEGGTRVAARGRDRMEVATRATGDLVNVAPLGVPLPRRPAADPNGGLLFFGDVPPIGELALFHSDGHTTAVELGRFSNVAGAFEDQQLTGVDDPTTGSSTFFFGAGTAGDGNELWAVTAEADDGEDPPEGTPDLEVVKTASPSQVEVDGSLTYTVVVTNRGTAPARNVRLNDTLGPGHHLVGSSHACAVTPTDDGIGLACDLGDVGPSGTVTVTVATAVVADVVAEENLRELSNLAGVISDTTEAPDLFANTAAVATPIVTTDLEVSTTASPNPAALDGALGYTVWVLNNGPGVARDVEFVNQFGAGHEVGEAPEGCTTSGSPSEGPTLRCDLGDLAPGEDRWVPIPTRIVGDIDGDGDVDAEDLALFSTANQASGQPGGELPGGNDVDGDGDVDADDLAALSTTTVSSKTPETAPDPTPNTTTTVTRILPPEREPVDGADLEITKTATHSGAPGAPAEVGDTVTYTVTVTNYGPEAARNVDVVDPLGPGLRLLDAPGPDCAPDGSGVECRLGDIQPGDSRTLAINVVVDEAAVTAHGVREVRNLAIVTAENEAGPRPNEAEVVLSLVTADLEVTKTASIVDLDPIYLARYTVTIRNHGPGTARNARFIETLGPGQRFDVGTLNRQGCATEAAGVVCPVGDIPPGAAVSSTLDTIVEAGPGSTLTNLAIGSSDTPEASPDEHANSAESSVAVPARIVSEPAPAPPEAAAPSGPAGADLDVDVSTYDPVARRRDPQAISAGDTLHLRVFITNLGRTTARNVSVTIDVDPTLTVESTRGFRVPGDAPQQPLDIATACRRIGNLLMCDIGDLPVASGAPGSPRVDLFLKLRAQGTGRGRVVQLAASATSDTPEPVDEHPNRVQETIGVFAAADVEVLADWPIAVAPGERFTYRFTINNLGPDPAPTVAFTATLAPQVRFVSAEGVLSTCAPVGATVACSLGDLAAPPDFGSSRVVAITVDALEPQVQGRSVTTGEASTRLDLKPGNNVATAHTAILAFEIQDTVDAGETVGSGDGTPTADQPLHTSVTPSRAGPVEIATLIGIPASAVPATMLPVAAAVTAPRGAEPLVLVFRIHGSLLDAFGLRDLIPFRDGVPVAPCGTLTPPAPLPCFTLERQPDGTVVLRVHTAAASTWTFGLPLATTQDLAGACPPAQVSAPPFADLDTAPTHAPAIACLAGLDVIRGVTSRLFAPGSPVTRAQLASLVDRLLVAAGVPLDEGADAFDDDGDHLVHEAAINRLAAAGIVRGTGGRSYRPSRTVTRAEIATVLVRTYEAAAGAALPAGPNRFGDDRASVHEANIDAAAAAGLAAGVTPAGFRPGAPVTRAQSATFLARLLARLISDGHVVPGAVVPADAAPLRVR